MENVSIEEINISVKSHFRNFKAKPGSHAIASEAALLAMIGITIMRPPKRTLEVGAGLGTITQLFSEVTNSHIVAIETQERLFDYLVAENLPRVKVVPDSTSEILKNFKPDWVIIDGPCEPSRLLKVVGVEDLSVVIIENQRIMSRIHVAKFLALSKMRFSYAELDTFDQTGLAVFLIQSHKIAPQNLMGCLIDFLAFGIRVFPRFIRQTVLSRGKNFQVGSKQEGELGITSKDY